MKTASNLFERIITQENFVCAIQKAAKNKRKKRIVLKTLANDEYVAAQKCYEVERGIWRPEKIHRVKVINDGVQQKKREIVCPDFINEQIVHHAIMNITAPVFMRQFYTYSCASITGRGTEYAIEYIRKAIKDVKNTKYHVVLDIKQFFNSIRPSKVFRQLRRVIRDRKTLLLFARILRSNKIIRPDGETIKRGTPIGLYTSPWFANILLTPLDHKIKAAGVPYYVRYNDDMLLFHSNKRKLKRIVNMIREHLAGLHLSLKRCPQIHRFSKVSIRYIGATIKPDRITLAPKVFLKTTRVIRRISKKEKITSYDASRAVSYSGRFKHFDAAAAREKYITNVVNLKACKKIISAHQRRKNRCGGNRIPK